MKFERGKDPKESMKIGMHDALKVEGIHVSVINPDIPDTRPSHKRYMHRNPQIVFSEVLRGNAVNEILCLLENNAKFPWDYFFKRYPDYEEMISTSWWKLGISILLEKTDKKNRGYQALNLRSAVGKYFIYRGKVYHMKEKRP